MTNIEKYKTAEDVKYWHDEWCCINSFREGRGAPCASDSTKYMTCKDCLAHWLFLEADEGEAAK